MGVLAMALSLSSCAKDKATPVVKEQPYSPQSAADRDAVLTKLASQSPEISNAVHAQVECLVKRGTEFRVDLRDAGARLDGPDAAAKTAIGECATAARGGAQTSVQPGETPSPDLTNRINAFVVDCMAKHGINLTPKASGSSESGVPAQGFDETKLDDKGKTLLHQCANEALKAR
jgi:hypothetical protein